MAEKVRLLHRIDGFVTGRNVPNEGFRLNIKGQPGFRRFEGGFV